MVTVKKRIITMVNATSIGAIATRNTMEHIKTYIEDRKCANDKCGRKLSKYNGDSICNACFEKNKGHQC